MNLSTAACACASLTKASLRLRRLYVRLNSGEGKTEALNLGVDKTS